MLSIEFTNLHGYHSARVQVVATNSESESTEPVIVFYSLRFFVPRVTGFHVVKNIPKHFEEPVLSPLFPVS